VQVVLEDVHIRQYVQDRLNFDFAAPRVVLDEKNAVVDVPGGVQGRIEEVPWEELNQ